MWQLPLNTTKCKVMHIGTRNQEYDYKMGGQNLKVITEEKDLGLLVDRSLLFHDHTAATVARAFRTLGIIRRTFLTLMKSHYHFSSRLWSGPFLNMEQCMGTSLLWRSGQSGEHLKEGNKDGEIYKASSLSRETKTTGDA